MIKLHVDVLAYTIMLGLEKSQNHRIANVWDQEGI